MLNYLFFICLGLFSLPALAAGWAQFKTGQLHGRNQAKARFWSDLEQSWEPAVLDFLAQRQEAAQVWQQVAAGQELYFIDFLMRTALKHPAASEPFKQLATPFLPELAARLSQQSGDAEQRARAVQTLALLGGPETTSLLTRCLEDAAPIVTLLAALALSQQKQIQTAELILRQLPRLAEWHVGLLSKLLVRMGPEVAPVVLQNLEQSQDSEVQTVCLQVLLAQSHAAALPPAVRLLSNTQDLNVQVAALSLLGKLGSEEHLPLIRSHYDSPYFAVRLAVIRALYQRQSQSDQQIFQQAFDDSSHWVALQAAQALKATGHEHILHELTFLQHPRAGLATQVLNAYDDLQELEKAVQNPEFRHRVGMLFQSLQAQDSRGMQQIMTRLFFHPKTHPEVRYTMARELARFRNYQFFYQTLSSFILGFHDQRSLIRALHSFANPESVPAMIEYYRNQASWEEKLEIVDALGDIESMESLAFLSKIYNDLYEHGMPEQLDQQIVELQQRLATALARKMSL